jgi:eukaryotic-like serine/threonine-protein kinase
MPLTASEEGAPLKGPLLAETAVVYGAQILEAMEQTQGSVRISDIRLMPDGGIRLLHTVQDQPTQDTVYAFGAVLYEMLMGRGLSADRMRVQPAALEAVLSKCIDKDPEHRWKSLGELKQALAGSLKRRYVREYTLGAAALVMLGVGLGLLWLEGIGAKPLNDRDLVVLGDFANNTGDPLFDGTLRAAAVMQLSQSPFLKIIGGVVPTREACKELGAKVMISGSVARSGIRHTVNVQAVNCEASGLLAREQVRADGPEQVMNALSQAATAMRADLGEPRSSVQKFTRPFPTLTMPALQAMQAYAQGQMRPLADGIPFFERATQLDPTFAVAYFEWSNNLAALGASPAEPLKKGFEQAGNSGERERLTITAAYHRFVTGQLNRAATALEQLARSYPRDDQSRNQLRALYSTTGDFEKALEQAQQVVRLSPGPAATGAFIRAFANLDRFDDAKKLARQALTSGMNAPVIHQRLLQIGYSQKDNTATQLEIQWFQGKPEEFLSLREQSQDALVRGQFRKSAALAQQGARLALAQNQQGPAGQLLAQVAGMGEFRGGCRQVQDIGAVAALLCSEEDGLLQAAQAQLQARPADTLLNGVRLPALRATVALQENKPAEAIRLLAQSTPYERANAQIPYLRGLAYLQLKQGPQAAAEFQKILDHPGANWSVVYAVSQLGVARAAVLAGDRGSAKKNYQAFFTLWRDADDDLPILAQAKNEYAALK